ncbi:hypothetical protein MCAV_07910 [[Mycoplasma] cavipharyngis]
MGSYFITMINYLFILNYWSLKNYFSLVFTNKFFWINDWKN